MSDEKSSKPVHKSKIGGQALIEGIMMRGLDKISMAVRTKDETIDIETWSAASISNPKWFRKFPFVRGSVNLVESMILGVKCLNKSAEKSGMLDEEEDEKNKEPSKLEKFLGEHIFSIVMTIGLILGVALSVGLFMYLPALIVKGVNSLVSLGGFKALLEGLIKITVFICYLALVSLMKDIKRTFEYHGAEHKTIACYEAGEDLKTDNVKKFTRFHPRCGTSFMFLILIISILVFSIPFITWDNLLIRTLTKIVLLPVIVGIGYELIRLAGRYDNVVTRIVSAPGMWLQRLTTREPDESQIEVAIAALSAVMPENKEEDKW